MPLFYRKSNNSKSILTKESSKLFYFSGGHDLDMNFHKIYSPMISETFSDSSPLTLKQLKDIINQTPLVTIKNEVVNLPTDVISLRDIGHLYVNSVYPKQIRSSHHIKPILIDYRKPHELSIYNRKYLGNSDEEFFLLRDYNTKYKWESNMDRYLDYQYINYIPNGFYYNGDKMSQLLYDMRIIIVRDNKWMYAPL